MLLDKSKILLGEDIPINDFIFLHQPTIGEVINFGEQQFFATFYSLCSIPSNFKSMLWDMGVDWNEMKDWELFVNMSREVGKESTELIFGDVDFSQFTPMQNTETGEIILVNEDKIINEEVYTAFISYVREMVGFTVKREKAMNKLTKMAMIDEDRFNRSHAKKTDSDESFLFSAIISLVNTEEFPYTYNTIKEVTLYQLMKSFYQIQNKKAACSLYQGSMSGFVDTSKIDKKAFQWIYTEDK